MGMLGRRGRMREGRIRRMIREMGRSKAERRRSLESWKSGANKLKLHETEMVVYYEKIGMRGGD
jgi:hypothetical protein